MKRTRHSRRPGLTLIELLVAIFIVLLITGIAIPVMTPTVMERRQRETSRALTSYLQAGRTRAIQTGRPVGVTFEPQAGLTAASVSLSYAEVHAPWGGDSLGSRVHIVASTATDVSGVPNRFPYAQIDYFIDSFGQPASESGWIGLVRPG